VAGRLGEGMRNRPKPFNPYPSYLLPRTTPALAPAPAPDPHWWRVPLFLTPLVMLLGYVDFVMSDMPLDNGLALGYLVPLVMVGVTWLPGRRTVDRRPMRIGLGWTACLFAFLYSKILMVLAIAVFVVALLTGNVKS
jgi:hypothetical protein